MIESQKCTRLSEFEREFPLSTLIDDRIPKPLKHDEIMLNRLIRPVYDSMGGNMNMDVLCSIRDFARAYHEGMLKQSTS